jgi:hypothetical protein
MDMGSALPERSNATLFLKKVDRINFQHPIFFDMLARCLGE